MTTKQLEAVEKRHEKVTNKVTRIATRCPSCGRDTLFIASGNWLTCGWLECNDPTLINSLNDRYRAVQAAYDALQSGIDRAVLELTGANGKGWPIDTLIENIQHLLREKQAVEKCNARQAEAKRQGDVRHHDDYDKLPEHVKEFDRVLARHVDALLAEERATIAAVVRNYDEYDMDWTQKALCERIADTILKGGKG